MRRGLIESLFVTLIIALCLRLFVFELFKVPTPSMLPTLQIGDFVLAYKLPYGLRNPLNGKLLLKGMSPTIGSVVALHDPADSEYLFALRVIAGAGDRVEIRGAKVFVNETEITVSAPGSPPSTDYPFLDQMEPSFEHASNFKWWTYLNKKDEKTQFGPVVVPADHVFVLPDHRFYSDAHVRWGVVSQEVIHSRIVLILFSLNFDEQAGPFPKMRPLRSLKPI